MNRLIVFWCKYRPEPAPDARLFLRDSCRVLRYKKGEVVKLPDQPLPYLCIVLEGLVAGFETDNGSAPTLREMILPMDYFTGTAHPFSLRNRAIEYRALTRSTLLRFPAALVREGQHRYPDLAELLHVLKQRKINQLRQQVAIYLEKDHYRRYCLYRRLLPDWAHLLPHGVQCRFLQMSRASYYASKQKYLGK